MNTKIILGIVITIVILAIVVLSFSQTQHSKGLNTPATDAIKQSAITPPIITSTECVSSALVEIAGKIERSKTGFDPRLAGVDTGGSPTMTNLLCMKPGEQIDEISLKSMVSNLDSVNFMCIIGEICDSGLLDIPTNKSIIAIDNAKFRCSISCRKNPDEVYACDIFIMDQ